MSHAEMKMMHPRFLIDFSMNYYCLDLKKKKKELKMRKWENVNVNLPSLVKMQDRLQVNFWSGSVPCMLGPRPASCSPTPPQGNTSAC